MTIMHEIDLKTIYRMREQGQSLEETAKAVGISAAQVGRILKGYRLKIPKERDDSIPICPDCGSLVCAHGRRCPICSNSNRGKNNRGRPKDAINAKRDPPGHKDRIEALRERATAGLPLRCNNLRMNMKDLREERPVYQEVES